MTLKVNIRENQNLWDVALQERGSIEAAFEIALENNVTLTESIAPGTELLVPEDVVDNDMLSYYQTNKIQPATK